MKNLLKVAVLVGSLTILSGCNLIGEKVEVQPAAVGKVMTKNGYKEGVIGTSKFRLSRCITYCDRLVTLDVSERSHVEPLKLFMPQDRLEMEFDIRMTLAMNPAQYDSLFDRIPAVKGQIPQKAIYDTYASQIIRSLAREILSRYTIAEIASDRQLINSILTEELTKSIEERTPYLVRYIGLADVKYPQVIVTAQINAAERREQIEQERAQLEISKVALERELEEARLKRGIDVEKAEAEALVNKILASSITPEYVQYHNLQVMYEFAKSNNKMIIPASMVDSVASQVAIGNQMK